jgi:hypothetical protein
VPNSNLILVVVNTLCSENIWPQFKIPVEVSGSDIFCMKAKNELARQQPKTCVGRGAEAPTVRQPY